MKTKEEYWDDHSTHVDGDIDSLQMIAGTSIVTKADFLKAMQAYSDQQNAELVDALKNLFNSIDRNNAVSQGFWDQYHAAAQVLKSHTNRP